MTDFRSGMHLSSELCMIKKSSIGEASGTHATIEDSGIF